MRVKKPDAKSEPCLALAVSGHNAGSAPMNDPDASRRVSRLAAHIHMEERMRALLVTMAVAICLVATNLDAQAIRNPGFDSNLHPWWTYYENITGGSLTPGTVTWDSRFGGSARMEVNGAPGMIGLTQPTCDSLLPGDSAWVDVYFEGVPYATSFGFYVGDAWGGGNGQSVIVNPPDSGLNHLVMYADKKYTQGTSYALQLVSWPGSATCWIANADAFIEEAKTTRSVATHVSIAVCPNPTSSGRTNVSLNLPRSGKGRVAVYDASGSIVRKIEERHFTAGRHSAAWNGRDSEGRLVNSGTYFMRLTMEDGLETTTSLVVTR